ncbi:PREDICTED: synaptotagmin-4 [Poecilia mexicana]|uniref:synaptotagmin-4 n=1 Tax=Poecilia formosa TaxID=48698 RepID=UPI0004438387|nr:PREDICTED: synaptotagmin-4 [Poecilia formosa]XP_014829157.1 PREDICTED: synaptotagmin-4 [Poecilia mexicana]
MAPMLEDEAQPVAVPVGVAVVSVFGLVFTASAFAWICCQRKNTNKSQKTPPYKFVHMLKGVDIYPESLSGKKKFAAATTSTANDAAKTDVNGNCQTTPMSPGTGRPATTPNGSRSALHLDLEKRDLNGNFTTKPFHHHHQTVRSSPDLELPSPQTGFTQPGAMERRDPPSPSSALSSQAPTPAVDRPQGDEKEGGLGTLHFSLEYQAERKAFIVHIKEAHGLTPTDEQSLTSDPYIKLTLLPEKKHRVKTRVLRKTLDPAFDETFSFYGIPLARVSELALHFMVLSFDRFSRDEVIGETLVPLSGIDLSEGRVLMSREIIKRNVKKSLGRGELLLSLCYQSTTNTLTVVVLKARHLPKTENNGPTDPYVKVNMYQGKKRICKKKTHVKKCSPNPVFNELFVFDLPSEEGLRDTSVELLLMDSDNGSSRNPNTVIGRLVLGTSAAGTAGEHWREICDHPRRQIAKWHTMSEE